MELSVFLCIGAIFSGIVYLTGRKLAWKSLMRRENKTAALHYALKNHRKVPLRIIRRLLREGADVNHVGVFGEPPLVAALSRRQPLPVPQNFSCLIHSLFPTAVPAIRNNDKNRPPPSTADCRRPDRLSGRRRHSVIRLRFPADCDKKPRPSADFCANPRHRRATRRL